MVTHLRKGCGIQSEETLSWIEKSLGDALELGAR